MFRKFRVMFVDGTSLSIASGDLAGLESSLFHGRHGAVRRKSPPSDAEFLDDMASVIGPRGMAALERINATLGLDYGGIDFAVNAAGDILFFEANATMVVLPPQPRCQMGLSPAGLRQRVFGRAHDADEPITRRQRRPALGHQSFCERPT